LDEVAPCGVQDAGPEPEMADAARDADADGSETLTPATSQTRRRKRVTPTSLPTPTPNVPTLVLTGQTPATLLSKVKQGHCLAAMESAPQTRNATSDRPRTSRHSAPQAVVSVICSPFSIRRTPPFGLAER